MLQSRRLQKSQSAHIKSHGFSLFLSFFSIIQRYVEGGYNRTKKEDFFLDMHFIVQKCSDGLLKFLDLIGCTHEQLIGVGSVTFNRPRMNTGCGRLTKGTETQALK